MPTVFLKERDIFRQLQLQTIPFERTPLVRTANPDKYKLQRRILEALFSLSMATPDQLARLLLTPTQITNVRDQLRPLIADKYIDILNEHTKAITEPQVVGIGKNGWEWLKRRGKPIEERWRSKNGRLPKGFHLEHELGVNDLAISALLLPQSVPRLYLNDPFRESFDSDPLSVTLSNKKPYDLKPDLMLDFRFHDPANRQLLFCEYNLTDMNVTKWRKKVDAYLHSADVVEERFGTREFYVAVFIQSDFHAYPRRRLDPEHPNEVFGLFERDGRFNWFMEKTTRKQEEMEKQYERQTDMFYFSQTPLNILSPLALFTAKHFSMPFSPDLYELIIPPIGGEID